ncbi:hypothetical protein L3V59_25245 [Burkholderia aenigmatica]|uniref:hypothetical protein n=1 Tax=Burkholderia aenigmatica TaxID=2015348 RepID=UPI001F319D68|nr:hypothetical protein [Burkholderia aenigmatica]UKD16221.1 hypothetical protein L3V59_25245 [Burkholderia aenigmatica]
MNKTSAFRILIPAALALTCAGFAQASADEVPRMSNDVYRTSVSFCSNVAATEKIACQGDMIAAGSRIVAAIGGLPPASATSIDEGARSKLPAAERKGSRRSSRARSTRTTTLPVSPAWCACATCTSPSRRRVRGITRR